VHALGLAQLSDPINNFTELLSRFTEPLARRGIRLKPRTSEDLRLAVTALLARVDPHPGLRPERHPMALVATLALLLPERPVRHEVRPSAAALISDTELRSLPSAPPTLLRTPGIAEVRRPASEFLCGDVAGMGWYTWEDELYVVLYRPPRGVMVFSLQPQWWQDSLDDIAAAEERNRVGLQQITPEAFARYGSSAMDAFRWLVTFGLLLDAERQPLDIRDEAHEGRRKAKKARQARSGPWVVRRYVYLDGSARSPGPGEGGSSSRGTEGLVPVTSRVRGHLKRQRCGPGNAETKWVYVADYEARRYIADHPHDLVIATKQPRPR
jgi:hypothetical protein